MRNIHSFYAHGLLTENGHVTRSQIRSQQVLGVSHRKHVH